MTTTANTTRTAATTINTIARIIWYISLSLALPGSAIALGIIFRKIVL